MPLDDYFCEKWYEVVFDGNALQTIKTTAISTATRISTEFAIPECVGIHENATTQLRSPDKSWQWNDYEKVSLSRCMQDVCSKRDRNTNTLCSNKYLVTWLLRSKPLSISKRLEYSVSTISHRKCSVWIIEPTYLLLYQMTKCYAKEYGLLRS